MIDNKKPETEEIDGERGITSVNAKPGTSKTTKAISLTTAGLLALAGVAYYAKPQGKNTKPSTAQVAQAADQPSTTPVGNDRIDANVKPFAPPKDPIISRPPPPGGDARDPNKPLAANELNAPPKPNPNDPAAGQTPANAEALRKAQLAEQLELRRTHAPLLAFDAKSGASTETPQTRGGRTPTSPERGGQSATINAALDKYIDALDAQQKVTAGNQGGGGLSNVSLNRNGGGTEADSLAGKLTPTKIQGVQAATLGNRDFLLTQGTFLDCTLETNLDSTVPGLTKCIVTRNIYSTSQRVILIERGTKIIGQYQGGIKQGQARIFVLWTRAETPHGVIVDLNSPGTDTLGGAGLPGFVDTHFWDRFGAALLISVIEDAFGVLQAGQSNGGAVALTTNTQQASQDLAKTALQASINIPPTLYKNHGEQINILVSRDLDFSTVYNLRTTAAAEPVVYTGRN